MESPIPVVMFWSHKPLPSSENVDVVQRQLSEEDRL